MSLKLKHARHALTTYPGDEDGPYDSMVRLFAQSAKSATPAVVALTIAIGAAAGSGRPCAGADLERARAPAAIASRYGLASMFLQRAIRKRRAGAGATFSRWRKPVRRAWAMIVRSCCASPDPDAGNFTSHRGDAGGGNDRDGRLGDSRGCRRRAGAHHDRDRDPFGPRRRTDRDLCPRSVQRHPGLFHRARQPPASHRARRALLSGGEGRADRRARAGQAQFRRGAPARRKRQPRQIALPGHDEPRVAHAAQRHPRLFRSDEGRAVRAHTMSRPTRNTPTTSIPAASIC